MMHDQILNNLMVSKTCVIYVFYEQDEGKIANSEENGTTVDKRSVYICVT